MALLPPLPVPPLAAVLVPLAERALAAPALAGPGGAREPLATAALLATFGLLLVLSALFSRASERVPVPVALGFLALGMLAGSEGALGIAFDDYGAAYRLGIVALALILFDGGLNTPLAHVRSVMRPAAVLATFGVVGTAAVVAAAARLLGIAWPQALLLGAVVSSTDAAAVFSVLRGSGISLKRRVGATLEVESGINDPMAVILTGTLTAALVAGSGSEAAALPLWRHGVALLWDVAREMVIGGLLGFAIGRVGRRLLTEVRLPAGGLYPVTTLALALIAYAVPTLAGGSGLLAVFVTAIVLGNGPLPYRPGLLRVHDALAWLAQIAMFLVLGLLSFPSRLASVAWQGLVLALALAVVARPLVVALCLAPFRYPAREAAYVGWVGLRGAVPIVLATFPVLAGAPGAPHVFDLVFFIVVVNALLPGATVPWLTRRLRLASADPPKPRAVLEIESVQPLEGELLSFYVDRALAVVGVPIVDLPFPEGAAATLIVRGRRLIAPKGQTTLEPGDHVYVFAQPEDRPFIQLMFGRPSSDE
jgi:cell volume regulation protein A